MTRLRILQKKVENGEGILSCSVAPNGSHDYKKLMEDVDLLVDSGLDQLLMIFSQPATMRVASIAPAEVNAVKEGVKNGNYMDALFDSAKVVREKYPDLPIIISGIIPDVISYGMGNFAKKMKETQIDAVDFPVYKAADDPIGFRYRIKEYGIDYITPLNAGFDMADDKTRELVRSYVEIADEGELFFVPGMSGTREAMKGESFAKHIDFIRESQKEMGKDAVIVAIGGINTPEDAHELVCNAKADGVHFSSAYLNKVASGMDKADISKWLKEVKKAMKRDVQKGEAHE